MTSTTTLINRNIALQAELHDLKHQLAEAERNTLWLIGHLRSRDAAILPPMGPKYCRAGSHINPADPSFAHAGGSAEPALFDTVSAGCQGGKGWGHRCANGDDIADTIVALTPADRAHCNSEETCPKSFGSELGQREHNRCIRQFPSVAGCDHTSVEQERVREAADDLLTFSDDKEDGGDPGDETDHKRKIENSSEWRPSTGTHWSELNDEVPAPTSLSSSTLLDSPILSLSPALSPLTDPSTPINSRFTSTTLAEIEDHTRGEWRALEPCSLRSEPKSRNRDLIFSHPFTDIEHNRLLGCAVFIESMNPSEAENFWKNMEVESFASVSGGRPGMGAQSNRSRGARGHVAEEWERYYLHVVRPIYLLRNTVEKGGKSPSLEVSEAEGSGADIGGFEKSVLSLGKEDVGTLEQTGLGHPMAEGRGRDLVGRLNAAPCDLVPKAGHSSVSSTVAGGVSTSLMDLDGPSNTVCGQMAGEDLGGNAGPEQAAHPPSPSSKPESLESGTAERTQGLGISCDTLIDPTALTPAPAALPESRAFIRPPPSQPRAFPPSDVSELFYHPTSSSAEDYRTALVTNIPPTMTLATLLRKVHTYINRFQRREIEIGSDSEGEEGASKKAQGNNMILSASLHATHNMRTSPPMSGNTACIVFFTAGLAAKIVKACRAAADSSKGRRVGETRLRAGLLLTPTRPCAPRLKEEIRRGLTRILYLAFPASASHAVCGSAREGDLEVSLGPKRGITTPSPVKPLLESLVASLSTCGINTPIASGKLDRADGKQVLWFEFADVRDAGLGWAAVGQWTFADGEVERGFLGEGEVYDP